MLLFIVIEDVLPFLLCLLRKTKKVTVPQPLVIVFARVTVDVRRCPPGPRNPESAFVCEGHFRNLMALVQTVRFTWIDSIEINGMCIVLCKMCDV